MNAKGTLSLGFRMTYGEDFARLSAEHQDTLRQWILDEVLEKAGPQVESFKRGHTNFDVEAVGSGNAIRDMTSAIVMPRLEEANQALRKKLRPFMCAEGGCKVFGNVHRDFFLYDLADPDVPEIPWRITKSFEDVRVQASVMLELSWELPRP